MWRPALRISVQLALVAPVLILSPFAVALAVASLVSVASLELEELGMALTFVLSGLALPFLLLSILLTTRALRRAPWRVPITIGLVSGAVGAVLWVVGTGGVSQPDSVAYSPWTLYMFGGPVVVAVWNLWRVWRREADAPATSHP